MVPAKDISQWQGNWQDTGEPIVMIKMSGGDAGLYMDSKASENYSGAVAAGRAVGGYHFIGWTLGAAQEAAWFFRAMSPVAENDVFALDIEKGQVAVPANAPAYVMDMINYLETKGVTGGLLYMNLSTLNAFDWSACLAKWGLWLADWAVAPSDNIPTHYTYVMQQYSDGPNYDHDEWFGTIEEFKKYGYHAPQPAASPTPGPAPAPTPGPAPVPTPAPSPEVPATPVTPAPVPTPPVVSQPEQPLTPAQEQAAQTVVVSPDTPAQSWIGKLIIWLKAFFGIH